MSIDYTVNGLIATIKRRSSMPTLNDTFTASDYINMANDEMDNTIVPLIMSVREDYFTTYIDVDVPNGTTLPLNVTIPARAIGNKIRDVQWLDNQGNTIGVLPRLNPNEYPTPPWGPYSPSGFWFENGHLVIRGQSIPSNTLRIHYFRRPNYLVPTSESAIIEDIDTDTGEVTLDVMPSGWTVGDLVNGISPNPSFVTTAADLEITVVNSPIITLDSVEGLSVGDYVALNDESPIPQLPLEGVSVLAQATVVKVMEAIGDRAGMQAAEAKLDQNKKDLVTLLTPRAEGQLKVVTALNLADYSNLRGRWNRFW